MKKNKKLKSLFLSLILTFSILFNVGTTLTEASNLSVIDAQFNCGVVVDDNKTDSGTGSDNSGNTNEDGVPNPDNIKAIYKVMNGTYGFSGEAIAGILGNWQQESTIHPMTVEGYYGDGSKTLEIVKNASSGQMGIGYGQWTAGRHTALVKWAEEHFKGEWWTTEAQLDFMFKGDGGFIPILRDYALNSTKNVIDNTVEFHRKWEISADSEEFVINQRGGFTKNIWAYMQKNGMDGSKDEAKIKAITSGSSEGTANNDNNSADSDGNVEDYCKVSSDVSDDGSGELGQSVDVNGKSGRIMDGVWLYDDIPENYKKAMTLPKFSHKDWSDSPFNAGGNQGQCTELTWAYMSQLWDGNQPTMGHGGFVWESYKSAGAKITDKPTVGYGFSAKGPQAGASGEYGHTGVVVAVFPDGSWMGANFNFTPYSAPQREVMYSVMDGTDGNIKFFSGVGSPKIDENKETKKD